MRTSESIVKLTEGLSKFHSKEIIITKDCEVKGRSYTFKYASLDAIMAAVRKPLAEAGLVILNSMTIEENGEPYQITRLVHISGEWIENSFPIGKNMLTQGPQALGGQKTYGRRYNITDLLSLTADEDLDGPQEDIREKAIREHKEKPSNPEADEMRALFVKVKQDIDDAKKEADIEKLKAMWKSRASDMDKIAAYNRTGAEQLQDRYDATIQFLAKKD